MTAVLYAMLVEAGVADWEAPVGDLLRGIDIHPSWRGVTARRLLGHTSGLCDAHVLSAWRLIKSELDERPLEAQRMAIAAEAFSRPSTGASRFEYANANYVIMGAVIEKLTGMSWEERIGRDLFTPLAMSSAGFGAPEGRQCWGHKRALARLGRLSPVPPGRAADNPAFMRPAGGVHMSLEDYSKFLRVFLNGGEPLVSRRMLEQMVYLSNGREEYSAGWILASERKRGRMLTHDGSNTMWYAHAVVLPNAGIAAAAVANEGTARAARATHRIVRELLKFENC